MSWFDRRMARIWDTIAAEIAADVRGTESPPRSEETPLQVAKKIAYWRNKPRTAARDEIVDRLLETYARLTKGK